MLVKNDKLDISIKLVKVHAYLQKYTSLLVFILTQLAIIFGNYNFTSLYYLKPAKQACQTGGPWVSFGPQTTYLWHAKPLVFSLCLI